MVINMFYILKLWGLFKLSHLAESFENINLVSQYLYRLKFVEILNGNLKLF